MDTEERRRIQFDLLGYDVGHIAAAPHGGGELLVADAGTSAIIIQTGARLDTIREHFAVPWSMLTSVHEGGG